MMGTMETDFLRNCFLSIYQHARGGNFLSHLGIVGYQSKNHSNPTYALNSFFGGNLGKKVLISHARDVLINLFQDKILLYAVFVATYVVHCLQ